MEFGAKVKYFFILLLNVNNGHYEIYIFAFVDDEVQENLHDLQLNFTTTIYCMDSETGEYVEYQRLHGSENRIWVSFDKMPQDLKDAFVCIEDERFYSHFGVDLKRFMGAAIQYITKKGNSSYGGSTITQQLIKNKEVRRVMCVMEAAFESAKTKQVKETLI